MTKIVRIKEVIQEYANCQKELSLDIVTEEIFEIILGDYHRCRHFHKIHCFETDCTRSGCAIFQRESGLLADSLNEALQNLDD